MRLSAWLMTWGVLLSAAGGCNSNVPETASLELTSFQVRVAIVRTATDPFLQRFTLTMNVQGRGECRSSTELFPDTGYAGRRNVYLAPRDRVYVVGQYDARIIDLQNCQTSLSEFRHLDRHHPFRDQLARAGADQADAEDLVRLRVGDHF